MRSVFYIKSCEPTVYLQPSNMSVPTLGYAHITSRAQEQHENFAHALLDSIEKTRFCKLKEPCKGLKP
jgi:hypothetical protein